MGSRVNVNDLQKCHVGLENRKEQKEIEAYFTLTLKKFQGTCLGLVKRFTCRIQTLSVLLLHHTNYVTLWSIGHILLGKSQRLRRFKS